MKFERCRNCQNEAMRFVLFGNIFLMLFKGILGVLCGSAALVADAFHSAADVLSTYITMLSVKYSKQPADQDHLYGHGKIQFISSSITGIILLIGANFILIDAIKTIYNGHYEPPNPMAMLGALVSVLMNEGMFRYQLCVFEQHRSPAFLANAWDNRSDAIASVGVLVGIGMAVFGLPIADPIAAVGVGLIVMKIGWELNVEAVRGLMDSMDNFDSLKSIYNVARETESVAGVSYLRSRYTGEHVYVEISVQADGNLKVAEGEIIVNNLVQRIKNEIGQDAEVQVFLLPAN
ncbi:MAG: magnetosome biogenesis CDF transporter MamB [Magnetococcales bacterium]|nr:magnetosome biogenesis CDF transporter MamB [Magnetococcales bacterium]